MQSYLTLNRLWRKFRVPQIAGVFDDDEDDLIRETATSAVSTVSRDALIPIVDVRMQVIVEQTAANNLILIDRYAQEVQAVGSRSVPDNDEFFSQPLATADWRTNVATGVLQMKPTGGTWPITINQRFQVVYVRRLAATDPDRGTLQAAAVLMVRRNLEGVNMVPARDQSAYDRIVDSVRWLDAPEVDLVLT